MSRSNIHITISTPCHESWEEMSTTTRGAFCSSCQKEVMDFTAMTDREVIAYLSRSRGGCGRFREDQIDTPLTEAVVESGVFRWRAVLLGILALVASRPAFAGTSLRSDTYKTDQKDTASKVANVQYNGPMVICGHVVTADSAPVAGASIQVMDYADRFAGNGAVTDSAGAFRIELPAMDTGTILPHLRISSDTLVIEEYLDRVAYQSPFYIFKEPLASFSFFMGRYNSLSRTHRPGLTSGGAQVSAISATEIEITGTVRDKNGDPVMGASIRVLDTAGTFYGEGAVSDHEGHYVVPLSRVDAGNRAAALYISYSDYSPLHLSISGDNIQQILTSRFTDGGYGYTTYQDYSVEHIQMPGSNQTSHWFRRLFGSKKHRHG